MFRVFPFLFAACWVIGSVAPALGQAVEPLAPMKFNEVREMAPGVFFRYSSISATDKTVAFGGSNNIWIVFENFVLVYDANFPKEAGDVIEAVQKTTKKPIRYVLDSHHHGDHAYGNAIFAKAGATVIAQTNCARLLRLNGAKEFEDAGKGPQGRKDIRESFLKTADVQFDEKLVFDDGTQRAELLFFGHAHTAGDAFLYLPKHKILCTGDACTNGPFNFMGHSDSASWIRVLEAAKQLDVKIVIPGHGAASGPDVLVKQRRYFVELRDWVRKGIDAGKEPDDIATGIVMPWHKEWTGIEVSERKDNVRHVFDEFTGRVAPWDLVEDFGVYEGPSPVKTDAGWKAPKRIVVPGLMPAQLLDLKRIAPDVQFVPVRSAAEAAKEAPDADAVLGFCTSEIIRKGNRLRWIHVSHAGVEKDLSPEVVASKVTITNAARIHGPNVSDQAMALLLCLSRGLHRNGLSKSDESTADQWARLRQASRADELHRKTMLVVGLGGIGTQIARRANAFGMRVMAVDANEALVKPGFVFSLDRPERLRELISQADVVVLACPLTQKTRGMFGEEEFRAMKKSAYFINIARGGLVKQDALVAALKISAIAGAGLDVTDPEPLPDSNPLWKMNNVVISPHFGGQSGGTFERQWRLLRENVRRFHAGELLLCVVDKAKGY